MTKQEMVQNAVAAAVASLQSDWEDEFGENDGGEEHFCVTIHNQDTSIFADDSADFER